jgi:hypothetical protein
VHRRELLHSDQTLGHVQPMITVAMHHVARVVRCGRPLLGATTQHQHANGERMLRKVEQPSVLLAVLEDVTYVARADAQGLRRNDRVLRGDERIRACEHEITGAGRHAVLYTLDAIDTSDREQIDPLLEVGNEHEHPGSRSDEWLVIAGDGQARLERRILDLDDRVEHHVAARRRAHSGVKDRLTFCCGDRVGHEHPCGRACVY